MAILNSSQLLERVVQAVFECGWNVLYLSTSFPFKIHVYNDQESYGLNIYVWNISYGGFPRDKQEFRIQVKERGPLEYEPNSRNLLLGWWDDGGVFAGFDFERHRNPGYSSSIQIKEEYLRLAYVNDFSVYVKRNQEIVVAFKPDFLIEYIRKLAELHQLGVSRQDVETLSIISEQVSTNNILNDQIIDQVSPERKQTVVTVRKTLRDNSFKKRVLTAYNFKCAFCGLQLNLVDAAHIIPVSYSPYALAPSP